MNYKLSYQKWFWIDHHWATIFELTDIDWLDLNLESGELLNSLIGTELFNLSQLYQWFDQEKIGVQVENLNRPFDTDNLDASDFTQIVTIWDLVKEITDFENEDSWRDDLEDFKVLNRQVLEVIKEKFSFTGWVWYLNKKSLEWVEWNLMDNHWVYSYYLVVVEVDADNDTVRIVEIGYD